KILLRKTRSCSFGLQRSRATTKPSLLDTAPPPVVRKGSAFPYTCHFESGCATQPLKSSHDLFTQRTPVTLLNNPQVRAQPSVMRGLNGKAEPFLTTGGGAVPRKSCKENKKLLICGKENSTRSKFQPGVELLASWDKPFLLF